MLKLTKEHVILGRNIARIRTASKMTQDRLSAASEIHLRYLQKVEKGACLVSFNVLIAIRRSLGCCWDDLFRDIS